MASCLSRPATCQALRIIQVIEAATFLKVCEQNLGSITPAEEFITALVFAHSAHHGLTPSEAKLRFEEFSDNFEQAIKTARLVSAQYPELMSEPG